MVLFKITRGDSKQFLTKNIPILLDGERYVPGADNNIILGINLKDNLSNEKIDKPFNPPFHDGFCYYVQNTGEFFIDSLDSSDNPQRKPLVPYITEEGAEVKYTDTNGNEQTVNIGPHAEIFNDYINNKAIGAYSHAEGYNTYAIGDATHVEGVTVYQYLANKQGVRTKITNISSDKKTITINPIPDTAKDEPMLKAGLSIDFILSNGNATKNYKISSFDSNTGTLVLEESIEENITIDSNLRLRLLNYAIGTGSHVEGSGNITYGKSSHAEGSVNVASGESSHAEGKLGFSEGMGSHSEGYGTISSNVGSHSEGYYTKASGYAAHAEGGITIASGEASHAEGNQTLAIGNHSHSEGYHTTATSDYQHVQGKYNYLDENGNSGDYAHIVGNGTSDSDRKNIHTLDWDGNAYFAGGVYVGCLEATSSDGQTYNVTMGDENFDFSIIKPGFELTIIPEITSTITGPSLSINGKAGVPMRVTAATTNSSFNGTRPDFINAGTPLKLMYMERTTVGAAAYTVLSNGTKISMKEIGTWGNGYYLDVTSTGGDGIIFNLYDSEGSLVESYDQNADENYSEEGLLNFSIFEVSEINWSIGTYYFSNGTDAKTTYLWRIMNSVRVNAEALMSNNAEGGGMYPSTPGKANEKLVWNTPAKVGIDINKNSIFSADSGDGIAYIVNDVPGVTKLDKGLELIILPNRNSASISASLNVNGLGAKTIRCRGTGTSGGSYNPKKTDFITANKPTKVKYDGTYWILDLVHVNADTIFGQVPVPNGGTGRPSLSAGKYLVGNGTSAVILKTPEQVCLDIGAAKEKTIGVKIQTNSLSEENGFWVTTLKADGISESDDPIVGVNYSILDEIANEEIENQISKIYAETFNNILRIKTYNNEIKIISTGQIIIDLSYWEGEYDNYAYLPLRFKVVK